MIRIILLQSGARLLILADSLCLESRRVALRSVAFPFRCRDKQFCALKSRKYVLLVSVRMCGRKYEAMFITSCFVIFHTVTKNDVITFISSSLPYSLLRDSRKIVGGCLLRYSKGCHAVAVKPASLNQLLLPLLYFFSRSFHSLMCVCVYKVKFLR